MPPAAPPLARSPRSSRASPRRASRETPARERRGFRIAQAYDAIREMIIWGRLAPGARIVEKELAEELGVSRTPVRSALHRLVAEGFVIGHGGRKETLTVSPLTQDDADELFEIIGDLEGLAARRAARRDATSRATLLATLRRLNAELQAASGSVRDTGAATPDAHRVFDADAAFHRAIVEAGAGPRLLAQHSAIKPQVERYARLYISALLDDLHEMLEEHEAIISCIESGNAEGARRAVQKNWRNGAERMDRVIAMLGERGRWTRP